MQSSTGFLKNKVSSPFSTVKGWLLKIQQEGISYGFSESKQSDYISNNQSSLVISSQSAEGTMTAIKLLLSLSAPHCSSVHKHSNTQCLERRTLCSLLSEHDRRPRSCPSIRSWTYCTQRTRDREHGISSSQDRVSSVKPTVGCVRCFGGLRILIVI